MQHKGDWSTDESLQHLQYYDLQKTDDYRWWNLKLKPKWGPKTQLQLPLIAKGKDNEMKIFEIITLSLSWLDYLFFFK